MRLTIQAESLSIEAAALYLCEFSPNIHEFYDQPSAKLRFPYRNKSGRRTWANSTADLFVISDDFIGWEEWKNSPDLLKLSAEKPGRFLCDTQGKVFRSPPAEQYAARMGLGFRIRSELDLSYRLVENFRFLLDFLSQGVADELTSAEMAYLDARYRGQRWCLLKDLIDQELLPADRVYNLVLSNGLCVDLESDRLSFPEFCRVFRSEEDMMIAKRLSVYPVSGDLQVGVKLTRNGKELHVEEASVDSVSLIGVAGVKEVIPRFVLDEQINRGLITLQGKDADPVLDQLNRAGRDELEEANRRIKAVTRLNAGEAVSEVAKELKVSRRTLLVWKKRYLAGLHELGDGYVGLLPNTRGRGNRGPRLPGELEKLVQDVLETHFAVKERPPVTHAYGRLLSLCDERKLVPPSERTFYLRANNRDHVETTRARQGDKAAYQLESGMNQGQSMPVDFSGQYAMDVIHADHTELELELVCSRSGANLGRPWLTLLIDCFSGMPLGYAVLYDPPSYRSIMIAIRSMVQRFGYMPSNIWADGGAEFRSVYFESLVAKYGGSILRRDGKPRHGAIIERFFGSVQTQLIHRLKGNTQATSGNVRELTRKVNPRLNAIWTLHEFDKALSDLLEHLRAHAQSSELESPLEKYARSERTLGVRRNRQVLYDQKFIISTLPTTRKGTAKVNSRTGVRVNHIDYWHSSFRASDVRNKCVQVRYDPYDIGFVYAYIRGGWQKCQAGSYYDVFRGRSERELNVLLSEHRQRKGLARKQRTLTMRELARLFDLFEEREATLSQRQQAKDSERLLITVEAPLEEENAFNTSSSEIAVESNSRNEIKVDYSALIPEDF
ncbi:helix-turn-helix domain-containing protein [Hahella sp. CR1]|uniref:helix-turn-helix domain-containing protein n=1 Tax=Hahella sp. CR1 TaxID=2992807 RepID=UPI0024425142|nr:helix-turn-helix domain-containing protein [Hahella sp. CR1]MDG9669584.1 helix-turn-helix domain-containing protein [Hahella sp. CR1]